MNVPTMISGVELHELKHINTDKGDVFHAMRRTDGGFAGFGEVYFTEIHSGAVKGWKRHNRMTLNLVVLTGCVRFVIYDDRSGSPTCGEFMEVELSRPDRYRRLTVAPGLWVAFYGNSPGTSLIMDVIPDVHDDAEADRRGISEIRYDGFPSFVK